MASTIAAISGCLALSEVAFFSMKRRANNEREHSLSFVTKKLYQKQRNYACSKYFDLFGKEGNKFKKYFPSFALSLSPFAWVVLMF